MVNLTYAKSMNSFSKLVMLPLELILAKLRPVEYARRLGVKINGKVTIYGSSYNMFSTEPFLVSLGDNVFISVGAKFICHDGGVLIFRRHQPNLDIAAKIAVGDNVFIGAGAVILKGVTIGSNSIVGANAVVSKSVPEGQVVAGNPAKVVCSIDDYYQKCQMNSTGLGYLTGKDKEKKYREYFDVDG
jgi:acetyltransferase-like isoleucine patch superfamily enzyme